MSWRTLFMIVVLGMMAFGGTFNCTYHSNDDPDPPKKPLARQAPAR